MAFNAPCFVTALILAHTPGKPYKLRYLLVLHEIKPLLYSHQNTLLNFTRIWYHIGAFHIDVEVSKSDVRINYLNVEAILFDVDVPGSDVDVLWFDVIVLSLDVLPDWLGVKAFLFDVEPPNLDVKAFY